MEELLNIIQKWGPYIGLPVIISFLMQGLKKLFPFFSTTAGKRVIHFIPVLLGMAGGLLLPQGDFQTKLLVGGALGAMCHVIYKTATSTFAKTPVQIADTKADEGSKDLEQEEEEIEEIEEV